MVQQILFTVVVLTALGYAGYRFGKVRRNILLGQPEPPEGDPVERWRNVILVALGQKKMFKRLTPAIFHLFIYVAFVITQIELVEIFIDGFSGRHRFFADKLGLFYPFTVGFIEVLSVLAFAATVVFLARRNLLKVSRFHKPEMKGWPFKDGNLILLFEIILLTGIFSMNGADVLLQQAEPQHYPATGTLAVSSWLGPLLFGGLDAGALHVIERTGWWIHILMVLGFLLYLPSSKHLHILLAFPNTYFARIKPRGEMDNMPEIMSEVKSMMGLSEGSGEAAGAELPEFGARDIFQLTRRNLLEAYSCTECGRCTAVCPANITGKVLSPRQIVMSVRDRAEEVGLNLDSGNPAFARDKNQPLSANNYEDGKSLFDYISREALHACTTCNACVEACPVLINPLDVILKMRRHEILMESAGPAEWLPLFNSMENAGSAWAMGVDRDSWARELEAGN